MTNRGGVLFEVVLSLAIFAAAAAYTLGAMRSVFSSLDDSRLELLAVDLARSKMAELEAGMTTVGDLRDGQSAVGSSEAFAVETAEGEPTRRFTFDLQTDPTEYGDLTLITLTVLLEEQDTPEPLFTLRQLVRLGEEETDQYQQDELLEDLPEPGQ